MWLTLISSYHDIVPTFHVVKVSRTEKKAVESAEKCQEDVDHASGLYFAVCEVKNRYWTGKQLNKNDVCQWQCSHFPPF